jgi:hypothetical protein
MMSPLAVYIEAARRVAAAPVLLAGTFLALAVFTAGPALLVRDAVADHLGSSAAAASVAQGVNVDWWQEFLSGARGFAAELKPSVIGFAAVVRNLSDLIARDRSSPAILLVLTGWIVMSTFLTGGILTRLARGRPIGGPAFLVACARYAFRLLRLNALIIAGYALAALPFVWLARGFLRWIAVDMTSERTVFFVLLLIALVALPIFVAMTIVADAARVRTVLEDRRSMLFGLAAGWRFARRAATTLLGTYGLLIATLVLFWLLYALVAPGAQGSGFWAWLAFAIGQIYVLARIWLKLQTYAASIAIFQHALAHPGFVAEPAPIWPESPAVDA